MLDIAPEVVAALADGRPVVALETTLVTHGLPRPAGLETAFALEDAVRACGAVPATIGVLAGRLRVGLDAAELRRLAEAAEVAKLNLGNLAAHLASDGAEASRSAGSPGATGSTTVAATLLAAHRAGIRVLATGGIGGVHRDATETFDVSSDLIALSRWPVAVVCAGAKAVLDLPRTREALETLGVPVYGFGTDELPAFYRRASGLAVDARFDRVEALAAAVRAHFALAGSGVVVGNPVAVADELPAALYETAVTAALAAARDAGIRGRALTPYLLERLDALTAGQSVRTNRALLLANARLAGELAITLSKRDRED